MAAASAAAAASRPLDAGTLREMQRAFGRRLAGVDWDSISQQQERFLQNEAERLGLFEQPAERTKMERDIKRFCHCCNRDVPGYKFSKVSQEKQARFFPATTGTIHWCFDCQKRSNSHIRECGIWRCHRKNVREFVIEDGGEDVRGECACCKRAVVYAQGRQLRPHLDMREFYESLTAIPGDSQLLCCGCQHEDRGKNRSGPRWVNGIKQWLCSAPPAEGGAVVRRGPTRVRARPGQSRRQGASRRRHCDDDDETEEEEEEEEEEEDDDSIYCRKRKTTTSRRSRRPSQKKPRGATEAPSSSSSTTAAVAAAASLPGDDSSTVSGGEDLLEREQFIKEEKDIETETEDSLTMDNKRRPTTSSKCLSDLSLKLKKKPRQEETEETNTTKKTKPSIIRTRSSSGKSVPKAATQAAPAKRGRRPRNTVAHNEQPEQQQQVQQQEEVQPPQPQQPPTMPLFYPVKKEKEETEFSHYTYAAVTYGTHCGVKKEKEDACPSMTESQQQAFDDACPAFSGTAVDFSSPFYFSDEMPVKTERDLLMTALGFLRSPLYHPEEVPVKSEKGEEDVETDDEIDYAKWKLQRSVSSSSTCSNSSNFSTFFSSSSEDQCSPPVQYCIERMEDVHHPPSPARSCSSFSSVVKKERPDC